MMKENETVISINRNIVLERYQKLLDYYKIPWDIQMIVWQSILESLNSDPQGTIKEIDGYWRETFGSNSREEKPISTKPNIYKILYESRREQWKKYREKRK